MTSPIQDAVATLDAVHVTCTQAIRALPIFLTHTGTCTPSTSSLVKLDASGYHIASSSALHAQNYSATQQLAGFVLGHPSLTRTPYGKGSTAIKFPKKWICHATDLDSFIITSTEQYRSISTGSQAVHSSSVLLKMAS